MTDMLLAPTRPASEARSAARLALPRTRLLAIGLLVIVLGGLWLGAVRPLLDARAAQVGELDRLREQIRRYRAIAAERPGLETRREEQLQAEAALRAYLPPGTVGVAGAMLQRIVKSAAEKAGATLQSTQVKPVKQDATFRRIEVRAQMSGTVEQLRAVLQALEGNQPLIFVDGLELRSRSQARGRRDAGEDRTLEIRLDAYALQSGA
jgi:Tfp pilus assembly protein PilO